MARIDAFRRGHSYWRLVLKYSRSSNVCGNGLAREILRRYLRMTKFTCLDRRESVERIERLIGRLDRRHHTSYHFGEIIWQLRCDPDFVWIDGQMIGVESKKVPLLKRMAKVVSKIDAQASIGSRA